MCVVCVVSRNPFNRKKREEREREREGDGRRRCVQPALLCQSLGD